ncbi:MAG: cytochrome P450, partial [Mycobacterium sp.]
MTSTTSDSRPETDLPVIPAKRAAHCPLHPPTEFADWRNEPGLQRAVWNGQPVWSVSRYQD